MYTELKEALKKLSWKEDCNSLWSKNNVEGKDGTGMLTIHEAIIYELKDKVNNIDNTVIFPIFKAGTKFETK